MAKSFQDFLDKKDVQLQEAFNSNPYELSFGKKNAGDIFFTFVDEEEKEFRIQFYTPQGLGKNVRQVFIGQKRGSTYPDAISRFKNPLRVIASMIEATRQFLATPLGKTIDGFAINFSKKALDRGVVLLPKIIRQSGLKQKLSVMDLTYSPVPDRAFVWVIRKGFDPAKVFDGPKMQGITWDDPDKVGDVPVQASGGVGVTDWDNLVSAYKEIVGDKMTVTDSVALPPPVYIKSFKIITSLVRKGGTRVSLNLDVYDPEGNKLTLPSTVSSVDLDISEYEELSTIYNISIQNVMSIAKRDTNFITGSPVPPPPSTGTPGILDQGKWKQICQTLVNTVRGSKNTFTSTNFTAVYNVGNGGAQVKVSLERGRDYASGKVEAFDDKGKAVPGPMFSWPIGNVDRPSDIKGAIGRSITLTIEELKKYIDSQSVGFDTSTLKLKNADKLVDNGDAGFTIIWTGVKFPKGTKYFGAVMASNFTYAPDGKVEITHTVNLNGKVINNPRPYMLQLQYVKSGIEEDSDRYDTVSRELSTLGSSDYNPFGLLLDELEVSSMGEVKFMGKDIGLPSSRNFLLDALLRATKKAEQTPANNGKKTGVELAAYGESIRNAAPKTRDIDWQVYTANSSKTLNVEWELTWRRNTSRGAFQEFKGQIDRANQYIKSVYDDAKSKGYKVLDPRYVTIDTAEDSDYSEYEQSMGGGLQINI
ncbi:hypothetical protein DEEACLCL_00166 [Salmonella phage CRW-SP2]|nr:hypothetical protein DEEACLCL_00166 [Salmonella phage CRW-SP2]